MMKFMMGLGGLFFIMIIMGNYLQMFLINYMMILSFFYIFVYSDVLGVWSLVTMFYFGVDTYSYFLSLLSMWIISIMFMTLEFNKNMLFKSYLFLILLIIFLGAFSSMGLMLFYLFFELSLIPTFFLVIYWGMNFERLSAAMYLMLYTFFISLPMLVYVFWLFKVEYTYDFELMGVCLMNSMNLLVFDYLIIFMPFFIKLPLYLFHVWLPKAHVEAPVYGSMILAAILLKLGGYGLIRLMKLFLYSCLKYNYFFISVSLIGAMVVSVLCLSQIDLKSLVAYSSVVHMNFMLASLLTLTKLGLISSYIMLVGHGLCSSGLFFMVNIFYSQSSSRILFLNKGMMMIMPFYSLWWFLLCSANFSFPLSVNFFSEILIIMVLVNWVRDLVYLLMLICFFSAAYSLYLYSYVYHGSNYMEGKIGAASLKDYLILIVHMYPLIFLILNMILFM